MVVVLLILFLMLRKPSSGGSNSGMESVADSGSEQNGQQSNSSPGDPSDKSHAPSQTAASESKQLDSSDSPHANKKAILPPNADDANASAPNPKRSPVKDRTTGQKVASAKTVSGPTGGAAKKKTDSKNKLAIDSKYSSSKFIAPSTTVDQNKGRQSNQIKISGITSQPVDFFGVEVDAGNIVFVIDKSSSMAGNQRFDKAISELKRSINSLDTGQKFGIVFFDSLAYPQTNRNLSATAANKRRELQKLDLIQPSGGTNPTPAIELALGTNADALFLLSDGEVQPSCAIQIKSLNTKKLPIHTVSFSPNVTYLKQIALDSNGFFRVAR